MGKAGVAGGFGGSGGGIEWVVLGEDVPFDLTIDKRNTSAWNYVSSAEEVLVSDLCQYDVLVLTASTELTVLGSDDYSTGGNGNVGLVIYDGSGRSPSAEVVSASAPQSQTVRAEGQRRTRRFGDFNDRDSVRIYVQVGAYTAKSHATGMFSVYGGKFKI